MSAHPASVALPPEKRRKGNIELLRIVSMLLILAHHMAYHGLAAYSPLWGNKVLATAMFAGGQTGVNCFVLITGYFLAPFRARRFFQTLLQTLFYSLGLTLLCKWTGWRQDVTGDQVLRSALIITRSPYWFVTMYLALTAALPLLQPAVRKMSRGAHRWVLIAAGLYLCVIPTVTFRDPASPYFHQLTWFFFLYLLGAYFRRFPARWMCRTALHGAVFAAMIALMTVACLWGGEHPDLFRQVASRGNFFADKNTVPQLICSCALFLLFAGLRVRPFCWLTALSGASFGVYLIHDHGLLRELIWRTWLPVWTLCQQENFWPIALLIPPGLYLACAAVDCLRKHVLEEPAMKALTPAFAWLDRKLGE